MRGHCREKENDWDPGCVVNLPFILPFIGLAIACAAGIPLLVLANGQGKSLI